MDTTPEVSRATALAVWPGNWLRNEEAAGSRRQPIGQLERGA
jgi:hypothetical protein